MELKDLENLFGVKYISVQGRVRVILPAERWQHVNECVDAERTTRLIQASRDGARECVDLLLRCGADVNARDIYKKRAIDYSTAGSHLEVTLTLLRWDSLLPSVTKERFKALIDQNEDIRQFFINRDNMHRMLIDVKPESLEKIVSNTEDACKAPRCWVNSDGESALYTAAKRWKCDAWALLRASGFVYATKEEKEYSETCETDDAFLCAIGRYFVELGGCHVQKMVARSKVYKVEGVDEERCGEKVKGYFKDVDGEECTSDLLKCLQDDPSLEVIFDFTSTDIQCMHPLGKNCKVFGLADLELNRIYVAAMETTEFDYSDVVSNLVHELAHKALAIVFENGGLPYRTGDIEVQEEYKNIMKKVLSNEYNVFFDKIIRRALKAGDLIGQELIVRVPEMIAKHKDEGDRSEDAEDGFSRLQRQVPELLEFYMMRVLPKIRSYIGRNKTANKVVKSELLRNTELLTSYYDKKIQVCEFITDVQTYRHGLLDVLKVSNLKLGVSHLQMAMKEVTFVDWTKYQSMSDYFRLSVSRNEIERLAIVWDRSKRPQFCRSTRCNDCECIARKLQTVAHRSVLIVPKNISVLQKVKCIDYSWNDLSSDTKRWISRRKLNFGGVMIKLEDVVGSVSGYEAVESMIGELLDSDDLSMLIDHMSMHIGRPLHSTVKDRGLELLHGHPESFIPRSLTVGYIEFDNKFLESRENDAFVIMNATKSDLEEGCVREVSVWDGKKAPVGIRCFILRREENQDYEDNVIRRIFEKLKEFKGPKGLQWNFVHFFRFKDNKYLHHCSLNCRQISEASGNMVRFQCSGISLLEYTDMDSNDIVIIADVPGSGKSTFVNRTALEFKNKFPKFSVHVVDLPLYENQFRVWEETELASNEKVMDFLYELIKMGDSSVERKIFNFFCQAKKKCLIFFDGFDEVCPTYKEKVTLLLETVIHSTSIRICLTTRRHESSDLEKRLSTFAYNLIPFDRKQQAKFLNSEWNASLKSLPQTERENKFKSIISCLQKNFQNTRGITELSENLKSVMESGPNAIFQGANFEELAEELLEKGKSLAESELDFSENPLHAWMLAFVAFEMDFNVGGFHSLNQLYKRFVDLKIDLYSKEKAKASGYEVGDSKEALFKDSAYELLKKFSAFYFLDDNDYKLRVCEISHVLRIGVTTQKENSIVFVHRTFGEYLFSLWLLAKVKEEKVTMVLLSQIFLENKFLRVREFLESLLLLNYEEMSESKENLREWEISLLSQSAIPSINEFVESIQKCLYKSILECHEGIFNYLAESSRESIAEVIFGEASWDIEILGANIKSWCGTRTWNTFTFLGECMKYGVWLKDSGHPRSALDHLRFLSRVLRLTEKHDLAAGLNHIILKEGLWWTGSNKEELWHDEEGKMQFKLIFSFLVKNRNVLGETLKKEICCKRSEKLFLNSTINAFDALVFLLDSTLNECDFGKLLVSSFVGNIFKMNQNLLTAWTGMVAECTVEKVEVMWRYLEGKLVMTENKRKFLRRKDRKDRNALYAAGSNVKDYRVFMFIWELFLKEVGQKECKGMLLDSFRRLKHHPWAIPSEYLHVLRELMSHEFLQGHEATQFLHKRCELVEHHLLRLHENCSPSVLYKWQDLLLATCDKSRDILGQMKDHYLWLACTCFRNSQWLGVDTDFVTRIESEFQEMLPSLRSNHFMGMIHVDDVGCLLHVHDEKGRQVEAIRLKAYVVVLRRQVKLEERILGTRELGERLKAEWDKIYERFPHFMLEDDGGGIVKKSRAFLIPYFFALISEWLSGKQVSRIMLQTHYIWGSAFHRALVDDDHEAFLRYYDVARWAMGENSMWRVHGLRDVDGTVVLDHLLREHR